MNSINFKFNTKRVFYIDNFNKNEPARGNHANKTCNEILFVTNGSIKVKLISQNKEEKTYYLNKNNILFIPCMKWLQFWSFQNNSSICVLCDEEFESDGKKSIFDFNEFTKSS
jgi:dTDP-4-dehydrorhamnose 3,5-epimerase-like enzyme